LKFLAAITTEYGDELREVLREEAKAEARAARERERLEFLAEISPPHERELRALQRADAEAQAERELMEFVRAISAPTYNESWSPALHPRTGTPPNPGWWATTNRGRSGRLLGTLVVFLRQPHRNLRPAELQAIQRDWTGASTPQPSVFVQEIGDCKPLMLTSRTTKRRIVSRIRSSGSPRKAMLMDSRR
jgi:hypothetical protein